MSSISLPALPSFLSSLYSLIRWYTEQIIRVIISFIHFKRIHRNMLSFKRRNMIHFHIPHKRQSSLIRLDSNIWIIYNEKNFYNEIYWNRLEWLHANGNLLFWMPGSWNWQEFELVCLFGTSRVFWCSGPSGVLKINGLKTQWTSSKHMLVRYTLRGTPRSQFLCQNLWK